MAKAKTKPSWKVSAEAIRAGIAEDATDSKAEWILCGGAEMGVDEGGLMIAGSLSGRECRELRDILNFMYPKDKD